VEITSPNDQQKQQGLHLLTALRSTYPYRYGVAVLLWTGDTNTPFHGWTLFTNRRGAVNGAKRRQITVAYILG